MTVDIFLKSAYTTHSKGNDEDRAL